ncbi:MAG TPA: hypothetical protein VGK74_03715 [Symbiobacteriaceae bacterium]|jgi:hypothetical protein
MSDIGISYSAQTAPSPLGAKVALSLSGAGAGVTVQATVRSVDTCVVTLTPSGSVDQQILSGIAWPLAQTIGLILPPIIVGAVMTNYAFTGPTITTPAVSIQGEQVALRLDNPSLTTHDGMLMVQGKLGVA